MKIKNIISVKTNSFLTNKKINYFSLLIMLILSFSFFISEINSNSSGSSSIHNSQVITHNALPSYKSISTTSTLTAGQYGLEFSTFLGGSSTDNFISNGMTIDTSGNIYITGYTKSSDFPTRNAYNSTYGGGVSFGDAFVAKFNATGYLLFSTYLGGNKDDEGNGIAVDNHGNIYVTGGTSSSNFPTKNAYQPAIKSANIDCFLTKFDPTGALLFSTYLGGTGNDDCFSLAIDASGNSYMTGYTTSSDFPMKSAYNSTYSGTEDAFVAKIDSLGALVFSTYLGGSNTDTGDGIAVDTNGNIYVTGATASTNFPTKSAFQATFGGGTNDVFLTEYNATGSLSFSTYLGGTGDDEPQALTVDANGNSYITGYTASSNFPTKNAYNATYGGYSLDDTFITTFYANHTLDYSTYLGGTGDDAGESIIVDSKGNSYITGYTSSTNFPTRNAYDAIYGGNFSYDAYVTMLNKTGMLVFSTYIGGTGVEYGYGIAVNSNGDIYTTGYTESSNFPTKNAYYPTYNGGGDIYVMKFTNPNPPVVATSTTSSSSPTTSTASSMPPTTSTNPSSSGASLFDQALLSNPVFDIVTVIAVLAILSNIILIIRRRK